MRRWQFKVVHHKSLAGIGGTEPIEDVSQASWLDQFGRDGWELVSVTVQSYRREYDPTALQGYSFFSYYFKREQT